MTSRKLSESDKQQMLQLYRQPGETTSTLADRYGVSNSTISRILKSSFSEAEYETLIQQKRGNRTSSETPSTTDSEASDLETAELETAELETAELETAEPQAVVVKALEAEPLVSATSEPLDLEEFAVEAAAIESLPVPARDMSQAVPLEEPTTLTENGRRLRKRSSASSESIPAMVPIAPPTVPIAPPTVKKRILDLVGQSPLADRDHTVPFDDASAYADLTYDAAVEIAETLTGEALLQDEPDLTGDLEGELDDDLDDDDLDDDLDEDDLEDDLEDEALLTGSRIAGKALVQVLPLAEASLPRTCYLVVDRSAELIARPLKEFGDLGQIPEAEVLEKTLPVFDNHRVAKRYSNPRTQRVIKLPDAQVLQKTSSHLQAKGITRLLIDGQVYAL